MSMRLQTQAKTAPAPSFTPVMSGLLQRKCVCGGSAGLDGECEECRKTRLQRRAANDAELTTVSPIVHDVLHSPGQPLDSNTRAFMEPRFGHDFSKVRVHTDSRATESARVVNALAYTVGRDVVFGIGQYKPSTIEGRQLMRHELTHVVQQAGKHTPPRGNLAIDSANSPLERQARQIADSFPQSASEVKTEDGMLKQRLTNSSQQHAFNVSLSHAGLIQRQEMCTAEEISSIGQSGGDVVYDYEKQECRLASADEPETSAPETDSVDGEFWMLPPGVPKDSVPIFDDEDTQVVVGFRTRGSVYRIYDLNGTFVSIEEPGLESPLIDPIDILAGGIAGLGRGLGRGLTRGVAGGAGRGAASAAGAAGLRTAIRTLSRSVATAIRGIYRAIRFRGPLNFTGTTAARMADPARRVPHHILKLAIRFGPRSADPQGVAGAFRYTIQMFRNGTEYALEVVLRESDQTVLHFLYR